jgi:hypothetical protein
MLILNKVVREIEEVSDVVCNKCGKTCLRGDDHGKEPYGLIEAEVGTGYYSTSLPDGHTYTFSICEDCLAELFKDFKVQPEVESMFEGMEKEEVN